MGTTKALSEKALSGGILTAMLTPFGDDGTIDIDGIAPLVDYIMSTGVDGLYAGGSSGECILQSREERALLLRELATYTHSNSDHANCTLIAHVGAASTDDAVALSKVAAEHGYDGVSAIPPYYYPHDFDSIAAYYKSIVDACGLPLIIYNIPALTGVDLGTKGLLDLLQDSRIAGVKFTAPDLFQFWQLRQQARQLPDAKSFYFGTDEMFLGAAATGTDGGIGSTYNLIGDVYKGISVAVAAGDLEKARALQSVSNELVLVLLKTGVLPGLKYALNRMGVPIGQCRQPFRPPGAEALKELDRWLEKYLSDSQRKFA